MPGGVLHPVVGLVDDLHGLLVLEMLVFQGLELAQHPALIGCLQDQLGAGLHILEDDAGKNFREKGRGHEQGREDNVVFHLQLAPRHRQAAVEDILVHINAYGDQDSVYDRGQESQYDDPGGFREEDADEVFVGFEDFFMICSFARLLVLRIFFTGGTRS